MGQYGADISTPSSVAQWSDLRQQNQIEFGIARCYQEVGRIDPNCIQTVKNARAAGIESVDVYHFPAVASSATDQTAESIQALAQGNITIGTYWLDVERGTAKFPNWTSVSSNVAFVHEWIAAAQSQLASHPQLECNTVGIYTRESDWNEITGGITDYGSLPLWWIMVLFNPNGERSFNDFKPFAGWSEAAMVQWTIDQKSAMNLGYDGNWRPGPVSTANPSTPPGTTSTSRPRVYTVVAGDTLDSVAARFNTTRADLAHANDLINPADFKPGLVVKIP